MCMEGSIESRADDLFLLQVRLFRLAQINWNICAKECSKIFNEHEIYKYIETCYDFFHIQGDQANFNDITKYLENKGVEI